MPSNHAILSPSAAHRWLHCTAAPRLEEHIEDGGSDFAAEGSLAHAICALKLKKALHEDHAEELEEIAQLRDKFYSEEMEHFTDDYANYVLDKYATSRHHTGDARLWVEHRIDFARWIPDGFGTADAVIVADDTLEVVDFKYGKGVEVSATSNPQMMIYALGAYAVASFAYDIHKVRMTIYQPRLNHVDTYEMQVVDLLAWASAVLKPKAREAYEGGGEQVPGDWCRFCKAKGHCRALAKHVVEATSGDPRLLTAAEIAEKVLPVLDTVRTWLKGVEDYALNEALLGTKFPGFKLVEGRSIRKITDPDACLDALRAAGYAEQAVVRPPELRTITDLEKIVGRKAFAEICGEFIEKPQGKPTLVPESDKRPAWSSAASDFANF